MDTLTEIELVLVCSIPTNPTIWLKTKTVKPFTGHYGSSGNTYYGGSGGYGYDNSRTPYGPPQVVDYPRYGYGSGYGNSYGGGYGNGYDGLDWGSNGYGDSNGVYGIGGYDGINIGGKVMADKISWIILNGKRKIGNF